MENNDTKYADIADDLARVYGLRVRSVEKTGKGKNSQVYRVVSGNNTPFIVKYYFRNKLDSRDRLKVEFSSLTFLWRNGVRCIPEPIMADDGTGSAVYSYVEGSRPSIDDISNEDITHAVDFLSTLKELRTLAEVQELPAASEACFSFQELLDNIDLRYRRLLEGTADVVHGPFHEFIDKEFVSALSEISEWCRGRFRERSISPECLAPEGRTLSPSDFGFHNSIRNESGQLFFLDFEYFGWDDPAKTVSDFILHPAMSLAEEQSRVFYAAMLDRFREYGSLAERVEIYYPLYGLKWCLIFLNEFLPDQMQRRKFAGCVEEQEENILNDQLMKSKNMLKDILKEYKRFPYNH
jgi:thiamine kinase-like enzyme